MRPILTIAIPTYNREDKLVETLYRVLEFSRNFDIEILVSDNASTDNTRNVVEEVITKYPLLKYYRNQKNLGFDGNFLNCFERANGEYVWLLSDDDVLLPGAIESVLCGLEKKPICMHLNSSGIKNDSPLVTNKSRFFEDGLLFYEDKNEFLEKIGIFCTFVSSLIFNVDLVRNIQHKEKFFNTNILQSHIFLETMKNSGLYIIDTFNCVAARNNYTVGYDIFRTWIKSYSDLLIDTAMECGFDENRMNVLLRRGLSTTVYEFVITFRQTCPNEKSWDRECIWPYIERYPELIKKYNIAVSCSKKSLKWLARVYRVKRKMCRIISFIDEEKKNENKE